jgi:iron complex outermembrane receptor protein
MKLKKYLLATSIIATPLWMPTAQAADASAQAASDGIGEIVVTAQRREENIQKVPVSIQALSTEVMEQKQVAALEDYVKLVPSVTITELGPGRANVYFRGIAASGGEPTSGYYLDEVPVQQSGRTLDIHLYDIARVEALSGPQGTLFGSSAQSGVMRVITSKPDPGRFLGGVDAQVNKFGPGSAGGMLEGFTNVPVSDNAAVRMVGFYKKLGGFVDNTPATVTFQLGDNDPNTNYVATNAPYVEDDTNWMKQFGGRISGLIDLNDDWTVTGQIVYQSLDARGNTLFVPRLGDLEVHEFSKPRNRDKWLLSSLTIEGKLGMLDLIYSGSYLARQTSTVNDYTYYSVYYDSVPGYTNFPLADGTFLNPVQQYKQSARYAKHTQELRLSTPQQNRWRLSAGAFYQGSPSDNRGDYYNPGFSTIVNVSTHVPRPVIDDTLYLVYSHNRNKDYAGFGEASYDLTDTLTATAGVRYFGYKRRTYGYNGIFRSAVRAGCALPLTAATLDSCVTRDNSVKGSGETHKFNLQWQVTTDKMVYATYSTGFRPGGFNTNAAIRPYGPDKLNNFELGFKTTWNNVFRFNGAVYYEKWNGMQFTVVVPNNNGQRGTYNAGQASVKGIEADITWAVTDELTLSSSASYNDAKLSKDLCNLAPDLNLLQTCTPGPTTVSPKGTRLPFQPKFKMSATARYERAVTDTWDGYLQGSLNYQTDSTNDIRAFAATAFGPNPAFATFDFSIGGRHEDTSVELFIQNAFDKRGIISKSAFCAIEICPANALNLPVKPQFFGFKVSQRFY